MRGHWKPRHLVATTLGYWAALGVATLGGAARAVWRATHLPQGQGALSLMYDDRLFTLTVTEHARPVWTGSVTPTTLLVVVAGPPLLLLLAWLRARGRERRVTETVLVSPAISTSGVSGSTGNAPQLNGGADAEAALLRRAARRPAEESRHGRER